MVQGRGMALTQAAGDLDIHEDVLRKWVREAAVELQHAFPGLGVIKPETAELERGGSRNKLNRS